MNKGRVEAFTDAVVAIILTIMVLEFKTPETAKWTGIIHQLPYFFAYIVSFLFVGVAWYNHHYMFALALRISKKVYWINNLWLFSMSLLPGSGSFHKLLDRSIYICLSSFFGVYRIYGFQMPLEKHLNTCILLLVKKLHRCFLLNFYPQSFSHYQLASLLLASIFIQHLGFQSPLSA